MRLKFFLRFVVLPIGVLLIGIAALVFLGWGGEGEVPFIYQVN